MRYLSVCSGIEGASVAWHGLGWKPVAFSEIEKFPCAVLEHHYPDVPNWGDMTKFKEWPDASIELLVGGTPCQSFSVAGLRKGMDDPRGNITLTFLALLERYSPEWVVWENVPGVLSSNGGKDFGAFLGGLGKLGYGVAYRVLDAQYFGVAQRRRRVFVVGHLGDWRAAAAVLFERESLRGDPPPSRETGKKVAGTLTARARSGDWSQDVDMAAGEYMQPVAHSLRGRGFDASEDGTGRETPLVPVCATLDANYGRLQGCSGQDANHGHSHLVPLAFMENQRAEIRVSEQPDSLKVGGGKPGQGYPAVMTFHNRQDPDVSGDVTHPLGARDNGMAVAFDSFNASESEIQHTLRGKSRMDGAVFGGVRQGMSVRRLTPRECERLQGFPDDYTRIPWRGKAPEDCPDGPRYKALGNSWAVPVVKWIGERIEMFRELQAGQ